MDEKDDCLYLIYKDSRSLDENKAKEIVNEFSHIFNGYDKVRLVFEVNKESKSSLKEAIFQNENNLENGEICKKVEITSTPEREAFKKTVILPTFTNNTNSKEMNFSIKRAFLEGIGVPLIPNKRFQNVDLMDVEWERFRRFKRTAQLISQDFPNQNSLFVLDVGGDDGLFAAFIPQHYVFLADERTTKIDVLNLDLPLNFFDIVVAHDVIEHIPVLLRRDTIARCAYWASSKVYISFPYYEEIQKIAFELTGNLWLKDHLLKGIPRKEEIEFYLSSLGLTDFMEYFYCYSGTWLAMLLNFHNLPTEKFKKLNRVINMLEEFDHHPPFLRITFAISTPSFQQLKEEIYKPSLKEMVFTGERMIPGSSDWATEMQHVRRYQFATDFVENLTVLDLACGEGYGSYLLSLKANKVVGVDISKDTIDHASKTYQRDNLEFLVGDAHLLSFEDNSFDVIVSFETIEHLKSPLKFLQEIQRVLKPGGLLILSSPNRTLVSRDSKKPLNPFHLQEWNLREFKELINHFFSQSVFYGQSSIPPFAISQGASEKDLFFIVHAKKSLEKVLSLESTSIIILTRNNLEYTKMCLESIRRYTPEPHEIIVVDNGSTDGTIEYLEAQEDVKLIKNGLNLGFALGNNLGLREARGEYIVILNNDTVVTEGWLTWLINSAQSNPQVGIVGPRSNYVVGVQLVKNVPYGDNMDAMQEFARQWSLENSGRYEEALRVIGFCMLVKREVIEKIGGFDPYYEAGNFEDDDFCIRAQRAGFKIRIAHDVFIHHFGSKTFQSEKIDYRQVMLTNWERFKSKWGLPRELPIERGYPIYELIQGGFDQDKHFVPLSIEPLSLEELRSQTYLSEFNTLTLRWFLSNFEPQDDVTLVIYHPEEKAEEEVAKAIQELGYDIDKTPDILLYSHPLPENKIPSLVAAVDKVVVDSDSSPFLIWAKYLNKEVVEIETALHEP